MVELPVQSQQRGLRTFMGELEAEAEFLPGKRSYPTWQSLPAETVAESAEPLPHSSDLPLAVHNKKGIDHVHTEIRS